jgi:hypothetical protein
MADFASASVLPTAEERPTIPLWDDEDQPSAGRALRLSRSATYAAARAGQIPGVFRVGGRWLVATATLRKALDLDASNNG